MLSVQTLIRESRQGGRARRTKSSPDHEEDHRRLMAAIDQLPELERLVLGLRYYEALQPRQISAILELPVEQVKETLAQAIRQAAELMQKAPSAPESTPGESRKQSGAAGCANPRKGSGRSR